MRRWFVASCFVVGGLMVLAAIVVLLEFLPVTIVYRNETADVERAAREIESFRRANGALPTESQIGRHSSRMFYVPYLDGGFEIGFSVGFDEYYYFLPESGRWTESL